MLILSAVNGSTSLTESSLAMMAVLVSTVPPRIVPVTRTVITRSLTVAVPMFSIGSSSRRRLDPLSHAQVGRWRAEDVDHLVGIRLGVGDGHTCPGSRSQPTAPKSQEGLPTPRSRAMIWIAAMHPLPLLHTIAHSSYPAFRLPSQHHRSTVSHIGPERERRDLPRVHESQS